MPRRSTMADVAREADVSLMTVSRVVNNKPGISDATRQRIQAIIEKLDYRPSDIARGLATNRTGTLGLVVPDIANPFFSELGRGAEDTAYNEGYNIFLCNTGEDHARERIVLQSLEEKRVDGVLLCSSRLSDDELHTIIKRYPAIVLVNRESIAHASSLIVDDRLGAQSIMQHLIECGHREFGLITGPASSYSGQQREAGFAEALKKASIPFDAERIWSCKPSVEPGKAAAQGLLTRYPQITALVCYNDLVAVGALQACEAMGRAVPDDIAVTGFDDIPLSMWVHPALTTCHVPRYQVGQEAMQMLLAQITAKSTPPTPSGKIIRPTLVKRGSTR